MKITTHNRLIGVAVILIVVFMLTWLIPTRKPRPTRHAVPVAAVPVGAKANSESNQQGVAIVSTSATPSGSTASERSLAEVSSAQMPTAISSPATTGASANAASNGNESVTTNPTPPLSTASQAISGYAASSQQSESASVTAKPARLTTTSHHEKANRARSPKTTRGFYVQVGSYSSLSGAKKVLTRLRSKGIRARVDRAIVGGHRYYRVRIGSFSQKSSANNMRKRVSDVGYRTARVFTGK